MRLLRPFLALVNLAWVTLVVAQAPIDLPFYTFTPSTYVNSTGLTDLVQWDGYSLFVKGQRIYVYSGEIHNVRMVNPGLYPDIMQRIKGLGFNAISSYFFWGLINPAPGDFDMSGWKSLEPFLQAANDAGLWVIARPGPWVQGEFSASGLPAWVTALNVSIRTSDPTWIDAYTPYWQAVGEVIEKHQITHGGPVIAVQMENEYYLDGSASGDLDLNYVQGLEDKMRSYGIVVPLSFNDNPESYNLVSGKGSVDLYGVDNYPQNSNCSKNDYWTSVQTWTRPYLQNTSGLHGEPFFIPEFQGGWIPGVDTEGYDRCLPLFSSQFERVFYLNNVAQSIKLQNIYMIYGGTNFGHTGYSRTLTSYDYWAAIEENRSLRDKYYELKLISHFIRSARDLPKTWVTQSGNNTGTSAEPSTIQVDELRNPDTSAGFYVVRHANSTLSDVTTFELDVTDWQGNSSVPITLNGRDSRIIVSNYCWGASCISHSSAAVMTSTSLGDVDYLVVYGEPGYPYTLAFPDDNCKIDQLSGSSKVASSPSNGRTVMNFNVSSDEPSVIDVTGGTRDVRVIILDTQTAYFTWEVVIPTEGTFGNHYLIGSNETALVIGPYFVRSASCSGSMLNLYGDLNATTTVYIGAPAKYTSFTWNNASISPTTTSTGLLSITLPGPSNVPSAPSISGWKWKDSLPEITYGYDDSTWTVANDTSTNNTYKPYPDFTGKYVLYGQNYGYAIGSILFRGHFMGTGNETGLNVSLSAGTFGVGAFFLNGQYLSSAVVQNLHGIEDHNVTLTFPSGSVKTNSDNYIQIVVDTAGLEEGSTFTDTPQDAQSPRGIRGYTLLGGDSSGYEMTWKIQGNQGGWTSFPDRVRSLYNVGGLYGEREGWYLPGYDDSEWQSGGPDELSDGPGVKFYRGTVDVDYPDGLDIHYSFVFPNTTGAGYRGQLFVNGWQFARVYGDIDNTQKAYPVPPGVLVQGSNSIAFSFFSYNATQASFKLGGEITLQVDTAVTTSSLELRSLNVQSPTYDEVMGGQGQDS